MNVTDTSGSKYIIVSYGEPADRLLDWRWQCSKRSVPLVAIVEDDSHDAVYRRMVIATDQSMLPLLTAAEWRPLRRAIKKQFPVGWSLDCGPRVHWVLTGPCTGNPEMFGGPEIVFLHSLQEADSGLRPLTPDEARNVANRLFDLFMAARRPHGT